MKASVCKTFQFHAAHRLLNHGGKCRNLHGHTYRVDISVFGEIQEEAGPSQGMVLDFDDLKRAWSKLEPLLDHKTLLDFHDPLFQAISAVNPEALGYELDVPPTAENLAGIIRDGLGLGGVHAEYVRVWETPTSYAEVAGR